MSKKVTDRTVTENTHPKTVEVFGTAPNISNSNREITEEERLAWDALRHTGDTLPDTENG